MDFNEALNELIDAVADVEEHGDAIEVLQTFAEDRSGEADSEWKDKYVKLETEYKKRFKERMKESRRCSQQWDIRKVLSSPGTAA